MVQQLGNSFQAFPSLKSKDLYSFQSLTLSSTKNSKMNVARVVLIPINMLTQIKTM